MIGAIDRTHTSRDQIGDVGELITELTLSRTVMGRFKRPLFRPTRLGAKYPAADFMVDVILRDSTSAGFFFVQVRSTHKPGSRTRLPLTADAAKLAALSRMPAPTYVVGVNVTAEQAFIAAAFGTRQSRPNSITKRFPLSADAVIVDLYHEVLSHWATWGKRPTKTRFIDV